MANFENIFIVTYGRSGSTLLQGLLNSIDGVVIKGENSNLMASLFEAYKKLKSSKETGVRLKQDDDPKNPWYGFSALKPDKLLTHFKSMMDEVLLGDIEGQVVSYGFKEIRYIYISDFVNFLDFIQKVYPNSCFIFNTRKLNQVAKSGWWKKYPQHEVIKQLTNAETKFSNYQEMRPEQSFAITFDDLVQKNQRIEELFEYLGFEYDSESVKKILSKEHSVDNRTNRIIKLGLSEKGQEIIHFSKISWNKANRTLIGFIIFKNDYQPPSDVIFKRKDNSEVVKFGLSSPNMFKKYPTFQNSQKCKFQVPLEHLEDFDSCHVQMKINNEYTNIINLLNYV